MKREISLKPIDTTELEFKDREEFLKWREKIFDNYEQSKINYQKEMQELFGYNQGQES